MNKDDLKRRVTFGLILITVGIFVLLNNYITEKRELIFSEMNLELTEILTEEEIEEVEEQEEIEEAPQEEQPQETTTVNYETYAGILEIPKINFSKGFYKKESSLNNVKFNLKILTESDYPDKEKGNVIIIGHSGNYNNSYFANLYQLELNDTATITYNNKKYNYKIVDIYDETKDGTITIRRDETKSCLTLITCTKDNDTSQTVYILELTNVEIGG